MAEKELRKMSRSELIEIIYALQQNEKQIAEERDELRRQLENRVIALDKSGSIAEAALSLNDVFSKAQDAADQYLQSLQSDSSMITTKAEERAREILRQARRDAAAVMAEAEKRCSERNKENEEQINAQWDAFRSALKELVERNPELKDLLKKRYGGGVRSE